VISNGGQNLIIYHKIMYALKVASAYIYKIRFSKRRRRRRKNQTNNKATGLEYETRANAERKKTICISHSLEISLA